MKPYVVVLAFLGIFLAYTFAQFQPKNGEVLGASTTSVATNGVAESSVSIQTKSSFQITSLIEEEAIPFGISYQDDKNAEYGTENILEAGQDGVKKTTYEVTHWFDQEISRDVIDVTITQPKTQLVSRGTKVVWRKLETPDAGVIKYWREMHVWATKYDGNCVGCRGLTFSGTKVVKGVCAVDPKVFVMGTYFYVEGYGMCHAEDIGGAIKGNRIDLGYENAAEGAWRTGWTDIYLITSAPGD